MLRCCSLQPSPTSIMIIVQHTTPKRFCFLFFLISCLMERESSPESMLRCCGVPESRPSRAKPTWSKGTSAEGGDRCQG